MISFNDINTYRKYKGHYTIDQREQILQAMLDELDENDKPLEI